MNTPDIYDVLKMETSRLHHETMKQAAKAKSPEELRREDICESWRQAIDDRKLICCIPLPDNGLVIPLENTSAITITAIHLMMHLVCADQWQGDYPSPESAPHIQIDTFYHGGLENSEDSLVECVRGIVSAHVGIPITGCEFDVVDQGASSIQGEYYITVSPSESENVWNLAAFMLEANGYGYNDICNDCLKQMEMTQSPCQGSIEMASPNGDNNGMVANNKAHTDHVKA